MKLAHDVSYNSEASTFSGERLLAVAIVQQAMRDLEAHPESEIAQSARLFFKNLSGDLSFFCDLIEVDIDHVQAQIMKRYPDLDLCRQAS